MLRNVTLPRHITILTKDGVPQAAFTQTRDQLPSLSRAQDYAIEHLGVPKGSMWALHILPDGKMMHRCHSRGFEGFAVYVEVDAPD